MCKTGVVILSCVVGLNCKHEQILIFIFSGVQIRTKDCRWWPSGLIHHVSNSSRERRLGPRFEFLSGPILSYVFYLLWYVGIPYAHAQKLHRQNMDKLDIYKNISLKETQVSFVIGLCISPD